MADSTEADALPTWYRAATGAERFMEIGRYDLAEEEMRRALQDRPNDPDLHTALGVTLACLERRQEARREARSALALDPQCFGALALLSDLETDAGRYRQAEQLLLEALKLEPEHAGLLLSYARLMYRVGQMDKSEKLVRAALGIDPQLAGAHQFLALLLAEGRKHRAARAHGGTGLRLDPDQDHSHAALGAAYLMGGSPFKARRHLREAMRIDPDDRDIEEVYLAADKACRWTYLPAYYWSLLIQRIPGKQFGVWGAFVAALLVMRQFKVADRAIMYLVVPYILLCLYTWIAAPLTALWIKLRPPP